MRNRRLTLRSHVRAQQVTIRNSTHTVKELIMNARLLVALALPLVFVARGLPESRLSADQDQHHQRRRWH